MPLPVPALPEEDAPSGGRPPLVQHDHQPPPQIVDAHPRMIRLRQIQQDLHRGVERVGLDRQQRSSHGRYSALDLTLVQEIPGSLETTQIKRVRDLAVDILAAELAVQGAEAPATV